MKKMLILAAIMFLSLSGLAFADSTAPASADAGERIYGVDTGTADGDDTLIGKLSTGVYAGWATGADGYAIITMHENGSQTYGTAHDSTSLYRISGLQTAVPDASDSSAFDDDGWNEL